MDRLSFWSKEFVWCCFVPMVVFLVLHIYAGDWKNAAWQFVMLLIMCVNNLLLCSNSRLKKELFEQLQVNISLIEHIKETLKKEEKQENGNGKNVSDLR